MLRPTYIGEGYGDYGRGFRVVIYEESLSEPVPEPFDLDGCTVDYRPDAEEFLPGIIPSTLSFGFVVDDATKEAFIKQLIDTEDRTIYVDVVVGDGAEWRGWLLVDNIVIEDGVMPYTVRLTAVDGIKDLEFDLWDGLTEQLTVVEILKRAMGKVGVDDLYADGDHMIQTGVDWYEDQMPARSVTNDPMTMVQINGAAYYEMRINGEGLAEYVVDDDGAPVPLTYYDVLKDLCTVFNARLSMVGGMWRFINPFTAYTSGTAKLQTYSKDLTMTGNATNVTVQVDKVGYARDAGGTDTLLPSASKVISRYQHNTGVTVYPFSGILQDPTGDITIGQADFGTGNNKITFIFKVFGLFFKNITVPLTKQYYLAFDVKIRVGSYYLIGDYLQSTMSWSLTSGKYRYYIAIKATGTGVVAQEIGILTPNLPSGGAVVLSVDFVDFFNVQNLSSAAGDIISYDFEYQKPRFAFSLDDESLEALTYTAEPAAGTTTKLTKTLADVMIGDGITTITPGALKVWNGSAWVYSAAWKHKDTLIAWDIGELRVNEIMALCYKSIYMLQGSIFGGTDTNMPRIDRRYEYVDEYFVPTVGSVDYESQTMTGEWFRIDVFDLSKADAEAVPRRINTPNVILGSAVEPRRWMKPLRIAKLRR